MVEESNINSMPLEEEGQKQESTKTSSSKPVEEPLKNAWKQVENFGQALGDALQGRGNVVMVRVNDEALNYLDMLVEAEVVKSRSEAAALLINEGVQANQELFTKISAVTDQITLLREKLRATVKDHSKE